ncbi:glycine--tRNA ligase subunit beta [Shouchella patagoniensis]|uniref:glycine--tRNA ligase subunit beta n=1 Tax=Shouchella patagoniensis TaxID=228576 RepID=UPI000995CC54|nr:glycine--tRNA ligase subunit beta [Shouchella patagoniensis]
MTTTKPFLIEIGLEELPARFVNSAINQFTEKTEAWLKEKELTYKTIRAFATPRRLALLVEGLVDRQPDVSGEARGPAKKIALDDNGEWTKAALGFARGQGVDPEKLIFKEINGTDYVFAKTFKQGLDTAELLVEFKELITGLTFAKNMRWNTYDMRFARPIRWLVALYGEEVIPFTITDIETGRQTRGHRFLGNEIELTNPMNYEESLKAEFVIADSEKRKATIVAQLKEIEKKQDWLIPVDEALLNEVTNLVEYPTALYGTFEEVYLDLPKEVLITTMREHQRYFPVETTEGTLQPFFITVRNGNSNELENVARGNEKVLRARLADAAFFYHEDQKRSIEDLNKKLDKIVFHEAIGTTGEKVERTKELSLWLANEVGLTNERKESLNRAATFAKFDLVTHMVGEFPELQGQMGQDYASKAGESSETALAIFEQYLPRFAGDHTPSSDTGAILSIADKLDTIVSCFAIGLIPTGSQDPYALRRQATGIVQTLLDKNISITITKLVNFALEQVQKKGFMSTDVETTREELNRFFISRLKYLMVEQGYRYDLVDAVLAAPLVDVYTVFSKAKVLSEEVVQSGFKETIEALSRVTNLARKADQDVSVSEEFFENEKESSLLSSTIRVESNLVQAWEENDAYAAFHALAECRSTINEFFEHTMVMTDNDAVRTNRLALLKRLAASIHSYADFQQIIFAA